MNMIEGQDAIIAQWAATLLDKPIVQPFSAIGIGRDGAVRGAAIFNDYQGPNGSIELTYVGVRTLTRDVIRWLIRYAFDTNKASRVTMKTRRDNHVVRRLMVKHGFEYEATLKRYYDTAKSGDAMVFVLDRKAAERWR